MKVRHIRTNRHTREAESYTDRGSSTIGIVIFLPHEIGTEAAQCSYCINGRLGVKVTVVQA